MHHEEIIAVFDAELLRLCLVLDARHFHKIEKMIAGGSQDSGTKLREKKKKLRNDMIDILPGELMVKEVAPIERVFGFVLSFDVEVFDERRDALSTDVGDDMEGEESTEVGFGWNF